MNKSSVLANGLDVPRIFSKRGFELKGTRAPIDPFVFFDPGKKKGNLIFRSN